LKILKKIRKLFNPGQKKYSAQTNMDNLDISQLRELTKKEKLTNNLETNLSLIRKYYGNSLGLQVRSINIGPHGIRAATVYVDGMIESSALEELNRALLIDTVKTGDIPKDEKKLISFIKDKIIISVETDEVNQLDELFDHVLYGDTALIIEGVATALLVDTRGWKTRQIVESDTETSIRGPREAFIESINDNLSLLRRRILVPQLWVEGFRVGSLTRTRVAMVYIKGLAGEGLLEEMRNRIGKIDADKIMESGDVEGFIEDSPFTIFPLMLRTERPDRVEAALLEGQVAVFTDGTPFVLLAPATFFSMLQSPEDHFEKPPIGSFIRLLRYGAILMSTFLPGFYIAIVNFHPEMLPTPLFISIAATREGVPFPIIVELLIMESVFEILREAGVRLPASIGPAMSIVGALVLGDAAISAGIVSPPVVIVVALTAIASFAVPNFALGIAGRIIRFIFVALGGIFGLFGIQLGIFILTVHLCSLRSFGVPYLAPAAPLILSDMKDFIVRTWVWQLTTRPRLTGFREPVRQSRRQARRYLKILPRKEGDEQDES